MGLCGSRLEEERKVHFRKIPDKYETVEEVTKALRENGLEACQLIVGVDFTKSNTWTGELSFGGQSLHSVTGPPNPYLRALSLVARTLESLDDDNLIPCYGFGDVATRGDSVFSFFPDNAPAKGLQELVIKYRQIAPLVDLSGPTSFAPLIRQAMRHVYYNDMQFHVLLILADGQISAACMQDTLAAIAAAASFPLAIVMVGVGDGPWDAMRYFDDSIPSRSWDNFQFVEFNKIINNQAFSEDKRREASFALHALMELPEQYKIAQPMIGMAARERVSHIVASIPPSVLVNPPPHFSGNTHETTSSTQQTLQGPNTWY